MKFKVKSVTNHEKFTYVVVEPLAQSPLLLQDEIPPGCIQYILHELNKNKDSKDICCKLCDILCDVYMDNDTSRKKTYTYSKIICNSKHK